MTTPNFMTAFDQIVDTRLPPSTMRLALKLLRLVDQTGSLCLDWEEILNLAGGLTNRGSVRRHLISLKQAGIITYATNGHVLLAFCAYGTRGNPRADAQEMTPTPNSAECPARGNSRADASNSAHERAKSPPTPPYVCLSINDTNPETNRPVAETAETPETPETAEQTRSIALLTDPELGISQSVAESLARQHQFDWLVRQAFAYLDDLEKQSVGGPGALVNRIRQRWSPGQLTEADRASDLYARHHDLAEERRNRYLPEEFAHVILG